MSLKVNFNVYGENTEKNSVTEIKLIKMVMRILQLFLQNRIY